MLNSSVVMYIQFINLSSFLVNIQAKLLHDKNCNKVHSHQSCSKKILPISSFDPYFEEFQNYVIAGGFGSGSRSDRIRLLFCVDFKIRRIQRWSEQPDDPGSLCNTIMRKIISKIVQMYFRFTKK